MQVLDLRPAAERMTQLLEGVDDADLDGPTPCPDLRLGQLITHVGGFARGFAATAKKDLGELTSGAPSRGSGALEPEWRARIANDLDVVVEAWRAPDAWEGMTRAGGVDLPGAVAGRVLLDELVVHGWDVARASRQSYESDDDSLREIEAVIRQIRGDNSGAIPGLFGAVVTVPEGAPLLDTVLGLTGRDPSWSPR